MNALEIGNEHYIKKEYDLAKLCYDHVLEIDPNNLTAWHNRGLACTQLGLNEEAIESFKLPCSYNNAESILSRGVVKRNMGLYKEALEDFAKTFLLNPEHSTAYSNYGNTLREFGYPHVAIPFIQIAQQFEPNNVNYQLNESVCHLMKGDLVEGWKKYNARWWYQSDVSFKPNLPGPEYDGTQDVKDKIVVVYYEQGFGDSIQFIRFVPLLQSRGAKIAIVTKSQLHDLFKFNFPDCIVIKAEDPLPPYNFHVALMDLPKCFGTTIDTIPSPTPYLDVDSNLKKSWKKILGRKKKPRIGLLWSANKIAYISRFRRIELENLLSIVSDKYEFISLSYDVSEEEEKILEKYKVKNYREHLTGFYNTAGLLSQLDLVISIDTVIPHLSGSMGIPTWVMLADYGCDWRWFMHRNDSPFYNCMKLFRQQNGNWESVLKDITLDLQKIG